MTQSLNNAIRQRRFGLHIAAIFGGIALLAFLVWSVGLSDIVDHLHAIGWNAPLLFIPYIAIALCDAQGWACAIPPTSPARNTSLWRVALARLAGEAINNLTPTANIGGEPIKAYLLRAHGLTTDAGLASIVAAKTALTISQIIFILLGLPFFLHYLGWIQTGWWLLVPLLFLAYGFGALLIRWQRRGLISLAVRSLQRLFPRWRKVAQRQEQAQSIDAHLLSFYDNNVQGFLASIFFHFLGWLMGAAEVQFFFYLMGVSVTPIHCLIIETMVQPMTVAGLVIPGSLGVQEAGGVFLCRLLGIDEGAGLTLMALKRVREAVYDLIGLVVIARATGRFLPHGLPSDARSDSL